MSEASCPIGRPLLSWQVEIPPGHVQQFLDNPDAVQAAVELGRLDLASVLISLIGILLAIFGVLGFFEIRNGAKRVAAEEARKEAQAEVRRFLPQLLPGAVEQVLKAQPELLTTAIRRDPALIAAVLSELRRSRNAFFGDIDEEEAEDIATRMEGE